MTIKIINETQRGESKGYAHAYFEGYAASKNNWQNQKNPYLKDSDEYRGFSEGWDASEKDKSDPQSE